MNESQQKVISYYESLGSRIGYDIFLWKSQHFGFYPEGRGMISEKEAQLALQDKVAEKLDFDQGQKVLDAGCGQGVVSTYLASKYDIQIFGITIVPSEVKNARKMAEKKGVTKRTNYQLMDYSHTDFSDNFFDAIYTTETLSHSPDVKATLEELFRVLKPGGRLALFEYTIAPDEKFSPWEKKMLDSVIEGLAMLGLKNFRHDKFVSVLREAGFVGAREQNISKNTLPSPHRLYKFSRLYYWFVYLLRLQNHFTNTTAGFEFYKMAKKGLLRYCVFTAEKPNK